MGTFFTALGYVTGALVLYLAARRRGLASEGIAWVALAGLVGGVLGAKVTEWVVGHPALLTSRPETFLDPRHGGRALIGGILTGWAAVEIAKRRLGIRRSTGDLFALALPAGEAVGRIGCFLNACCQGTPSGVPWHVFQGGAWRHPAQVYSALFAAVLFGVLLLFRDRLWREGDLFRLYLLLFGAGRLALEFFRERTAALGGLSVAQWVCLELTVVGALGLALSYRRSRPQTGSALPAAGGIVP